MHIYRYRFHMYATTLDAKCVINLCVLTLTLADTHTHIKFSFAYQNSVDIKLNACFVY